MVGKLAPEQITPAARAGATGLLIMAMIYAMGNVSGAHFNPAVTFAFALRRVFPWNRVLSYWAAQVLGAVGGALFMSLLLGNIEHAGATLPHFGEWRGFGIEVFLTLVLVCIVLGTATRHRSIGPNAAIASVATVALCGLFSRPLSGAPMNPARSLAPALISG
jgi:aquaporin Z